MNETKKDLTIVILAIFLVISLFVNILNYLEPEICIGCGLWNLKRELVIGTISGPNDLDPVRSWDSTSNNVIEQVCEGLYQYNLSDPNLGIIPMLAKDYGTWDVTGTEFTIPLRRNIYFHDGSLFNADSVKWNFERINWFINGTGMLNASVGITLTHSLFEFPNGTTILDPLSPVTVNNDYSVTINLRAPYAILEALLCYTMAYMLSPNSTPKYEYIITASGKIVGTGPYVYDEYSYDSNEPVVSFHRWDRYWRTGAYYGKLSFYIIADATDRYNAIKGHRVDYLIGSPPSFVSANYSDPTLTLRSDIPSLSYYYLFMNNIKINKTWRRAISYAINYTYMIDELMNGNVFRSNGPLAPNFPMYNPSVKTASWNLAKARQLIVDAGITNLTVNNDTIGPVADSWRAADLQSWEYSYTLGHVFREDLGVLLMDNLDLIGIEVIQNQLTWWELISIDFKSLDLFWLGWRPDYLSPYTMIFSLYSNRSVTNYAQYHNHSVEMWLDDVLLETNATKRAELYSKILHQIVEVDMPHVFGYHPYQNIVHSEWLTGVPYNAMGSFYAYPMCQVSN